MGGSSPDNAETAGTARRPGLGKQGEKVYVRNHRQSPSSPVANPEPGGRGLDSSACPPKWATPTSSCTPRPGGHGGKSAAYPGRGCRGIIGHRPHQSVDGEHGNHPGAACHVPDLGRWGEVHCRLIAPEWDGALVVVRGRESRPPGEGGQQVRSRGIEDQEVAGEYRRVVASPH
jgi:hypothetical protein